MMGPNHGPNLGVNATEKTCDVVHVLGLTCATKNGHQPRQREREREREAFAW